MGDILRAEGICKTYHTGMVDVHALKKCDINIRKGEFTAIIGKSGSGKSTLLRILGSMDRPDQMSGGEQQRTAIARALIMHPAVVYADEPTGNLDAESAENVAAMLSLAAAKYKQTIVMVTHDKQMAEYADRILNIVDGQVRTEELMFN